MAARSAWLWVFTNDFVTVYVIRPDRSQAVILEIIGPHFRGVLSSDCFLASLAQTARQNGQDFVRAARAILCHRDTDYIAPVLPQLVTT